jgi:peroxiredoxin Q/BCP
MTQLKVGDQAPTFNLPSHLGGQVDLMALRGKTVVLVFFPLAWTPI